MIDIVDNIQASKIKEGHLSAANQDEEMGHRIFIQCEGAISIRQHAGGRVEFRE